MNVQLFHNHNYVAVPKADNVHSDFLRTLREKSKKALTPGMRPTFWIRSLRQRKEYNENTYTNYGSDILSAKRIVK
jgi:hypothetical protein